MVQTGAFDWAELAADVTGRLLAVAVAEGRSGAGAAASGREGTGPVTVCRPALGRKAGAVGTRGGTDVTCGPEGTNG